LLTVCMLAFAGLASRSVAEKPTAPSLALQRRAGFLESVEVKVAGRVRPLSLREVDLIETQGNYLALHAGPCTHLIRVTIAQLESKIDPTAFVRIHRRTLVRLDRVREVEAAGNGDAVVELRDGACLRVSRSYAKPLRAAFKAARG